MFAAAVAEYGQVSHHPPMLSISLDMPKRDHGTRENILSTREFTVNMVDDSFIEAANATAVIEPSYMDEWLLSGLTKEKGVRAFTQEPIMLTDTPIETCKTCLGSREPCMYGMSGKQDRSVLSFAAS